MKNSCAFSGNRDIAFYRAAPLGEALRKVLDVFIAQGVVNFYVGGAMGFDTLAALAVIEKRDTNPDLKLILIIPFKGQERLYPKEDQEIFYDIFNRADEVVVLEQKYNKTVYHARNRYLVDHSAHLIYFNEKTSGGTAYTVNYALSLGRKTIDLGAEFSENSSEAEWA